MKRLRIFLTVLLFVALLACSSCATPPVDLTLDANGGAFSDGTRVCVMKVEKGSAITVSQIPEKEGWAFAGWYLDKECTQPAQQVLALGIEEPVTLYAKWEQYTITFDSKEGSEVEPIITDGKSKLELPQPQREGYQFMGWYFDDEEWLRPLEEETLVGSPITSDVTVYAKWMWLYTVTFDSNGGTPVQPVKRVYNSDIDVEPPQKDGFTFNGWYSDREATQLVTKMPEQDITLYAGWYTEGLVFEPGANGYSVSVGEATATDILIPNTHNGLPVTEIADYGFKDSAVENIEITAFITAIGQGAFENCVSMTEIVIPANVEVIKAGAFTGCENLLINCVIDEEDKPEGWETGWESGRTVSWSYRFYTVTFVTGNGTPVEPKIWRYNTDLTETSDWEGNVFNGWYADEEASIPVKKMPDNDTTVYAGWYSKCLMFEQIEGGYRVQDVDDYKIIKDIIIPYLYQDQPVIEIGYEAFYYLNIESVYIPDSVTEIGERAFYRNPYLKTIRMPQYITEIKSYAFATCEIITTITIPETVTHIHDNAFANCIALTSIEIPESVVFIGDDAFSECKSLTSIVIPDSVTEMGNGVFSGCHALKSVKLSKNLTDIAELMFADCTSLERVVIPNKVETIGYGVFMRSAVKEVYVPASVTFIDYFAFGNCQSLHVYCEAQSQPEDWHEWWDYETSDGRLRRADLTVHWGAQMPEE